MVVLLALHGIAHAGNYTWTGSAGKSWDNPNNWTPSGTPGANDTVTIGSGSDTILINANTAINRLVMNGRVINNGGYQLEITQRASLNGGKIYNGTLKLRGVFAFFQGTNTNCTVDCVVNQIKFSGGTFDAAGTFEQNGTINGWGEGGCVFNSPVTIRKSGTATLRMGQTNPDTFNAKVTFICSNSGNLEISHGSTAVFRDSVFLNTSHSAAHISFCNNTPQVLLEGEAVLMTGQTGMTNGRLTLKGIHQTSIKSHVLTSSGNMLINADSCRLSGALNITAPSILMKNNIFYQSVTLIKTAATTNSYSYGNNVFHGVTTIENQDETRALRLANEMGDTFLVDVSFIAGTNNVQVGYKGHNAFSGNITINNNKVVFNASTGKIILSGNQTQTLGGGATYVVGKLEINKDGGTVLLNRAMTIDSTITFVNGIITTDSLITLRAATTCSGASNQSFVDGPVKKIGNTAFVFPVGDEGTYFPIEISNPTLTTDAFTARYHFETPLAIGDSIDTSLTTISRCNCWTLNRNNGTAQLAVTLHWDSIGCMSFDTTGMRVTSWGGVVWKNNGPGDIAGNFNIGSIKSNTAITTYQYFTIGRDLPVTTIGISLGPQRNIPPDFFGLNGGNTIDINQGQATNTWGIIYGFVPSGTGQKMLEPLNVDLFRYPAGTPSNYFDWRKGWHIREAQLPEGWLYNKFSLKKTPLYVGNDWENIKDNFQLCGARPLLAWNILTSRFSQEVASVYQLGKVNLPVKYIELGNEMYLNEEHYKTIFPSVESYYQHVKTWIQDFWTLQIPQMGDVKFGVIGADVNPKETGRKRMWLPSMLDLIDAGDQIDAITIHDYIGVGYDDETPDGCFTAGASYLRKYLNKAMIESEKIQQNTFSLIQQANSGKLATHPLEIWLTEYNNLEKKNKYIGTWPHGLVNALITLRYLETPEITKITSHTMLSDGVFGNLFESTSGFDGIPCHGDVNANNPTIKGEFTAIGNALNTIATVMKDAVKAYPITFSGNINVIDINDTDNPYPALYGWCFEYQNSQKEMIILNLDYSSSNYQLTGLSSFFNSGNLFSEIFSSVNEQEVVYGNATTSTSNNLTKQLNSYTAPSPSIPLPAGSLIRIYQTPPLIAELTDEEICYGSSTSLLIRGGVPNYVISYTPYDGSIVIDPLDVGTASVPNKKLITHSPVVPLTTSAYYVVTITDGNNVTTNCTLTVHPPIIDFHITADQIQDPVEVVKCYDPNPTNPQTISLNASFVAGGGGTVNSNYSYIWTPDTGIVSTCTTNVLNLATVCSNIEVNPTRTTTYTVFITDGQCWDSKSVNVVVPVSKVDLGPDLIVCQSSGTIDLKPETEVDGSLTYLWSNGATSQSISINPNLLSVGEHIYTLTVTGSYNNVQCAVIDNITIKVLDCCTSGTPLILNPVEKVIPNKEYVACYSNGDDLYSIVPGACTFDINGVPGDNNDKLTISNPGNIIIINGEFRLEDDIRDNGGLLYDGYDVVIKNATLEFGPESYIRVRGARTLTLEDCTLDVCSSEMWDGLRIFGESTDAGPHIVLKNCSIMNANMAVQLARDAQYEIENCYFKDNYIDMHFSGYQQKVQQNKTAITSTGLSSTNFIRSNTFTSSGTTLLTPYNTVHKFAAIVLDDVERMVIGDSSLSTSVTPNVFTTSRYGVIANKSSLEVYNNSIHDLTNFFDDWPDFLPTPSPLLKANSVGIYNLSSFDFNDRKLTIGELFDNNGVTDTRNAFFNMNYNIWSDQETNVEINFSDFGNGDYDGSNGTNCIWINFPGDKRINVNNDNRFNNFIQGVRIDEPAQKTNITIANNNFLGGLPLTGGGFAGTGVMVSHLTGARPEQVKISANSFGGTNDESVFAFPRIAVRAVNIAGVEIEENQVQFDFVDPPIFNYSGIWSTNCYSAKIRSNTISNIATPNDISLFDDLLVGIRVENCHLTCIESQELTNLGMGMHFTGNSMVGSLFNNTMDNFNEGIHLANAEIGAVQGGPWVAGSFNDLVNEWVQPAGANINNRITGVRIIPLAINWWHSAANTTDPKFPGSTGGLVNAIPITSLAYSVSQCPEDLENDPPMDLTARNANYGAVAADTARYDPAYWETSKYQSELVLFATIKRNPELMDFNDSSDIAFQEFYEYYYGSNLEKAVDVMDYFLLGSYVEAGTILSTISDTLNWEINFK